MPSLVVIGPQIKEKQRGHNVPPAYMVPKDPRLNRVKFPKALPLYMLLLSSISNKDVLFIFSANKVADEEVP